MSCPCFLLGKHECLALNFNATLLSFVVKTINPSMLLLLPSEGIIGFIVPEALQSFFSMKNAFFGMTFHLYVRKSEGKRDREREQKKKKKHISPDIKPEFLCL